MARGITAGMVTELTATSLRPITLVKAEFDGGDINVWDGVGDLVFSGDTYVGTGTFLGVSGVTETQELNANTTEFFLSGIPAWLISTALSENYQGRPITMWRGAFDANKAIIADPILLFAGIMDVMTINEGGDTATVSIIAESQLRALNRPSPRKWTSMDQKAIFPTDKGFDEVPQIQDDSIRWFA